VRAALEAGVTEADVFVAEAMEDATMVRVYARENATQRGMSSTALTGTVAAAMRYMAKAILTGTGLADKIISNFDLPTLRRRLLSDDGMGREVLLAFLHDIPGINAPSLQHQLANLKTSGDYARLMAEVEADIARDHPEALEAIATAREAARKAAEQPKTFDFEGVARSLQTLPMWHGCVPRNRSTPGWTSLRAGSSSSGYGSSPARGSSRRHPAFATVLWCSVIRSVRKFAPPLWEIV
jgi:hypothetical protein